MNKYCLGAQVRQFHYQEDGVKHSVNLRQIVALRDFADVKAGKFGQVPKHLRDAHYPGAKRLGHGKGYRYPHSDPRGVVGQQYLPDELADRVYYQPAAHGHERDVAERLEKIRRISRG